MTWVPSPVHHCPPVGPADVPILRRHLADGPKKLCVLAIVVASTGRRAETVRHMRWQDVRLHEGVWLYRPGRWLPLMAATCAAIKSLPEAGPWIFPNRWSQPEYPWSQDGVEKSWERFRSSLPLSLRQLKSEEAVLNFPTSTPKHSGHSVSLTSASSGGNRR
jgi:integrase